MKLYYESAALPRGGQFTAVDEEDCYTDSGRRRGIWLTSEPLGGAAVVSIDIPTAKVEEFEVTADGDSHRTFVVPHDAVGRFTAAVAPVSPGR